MSFILDALRRAEAERARGAMPGLHTPESALPPEARPDGRRGLSPLLWAGLAAALLLTAGLAWWLGGRGAASEPAAQSRVDALPPAAPAVAVPAAPPTAAALPPPAPLPMPLPGTTAPPAVQSGVAMAPPIAADKSAPPRPQLPGTLRRPPDAATLGMAPGPGMAVSPPPNPTQSADAPATTAAGMAPPQPAAAPTVAPPAPARLPTLAELPEATRAQVPPLVVGGGMYAEVPSQRLAILNGQVVHEGDQPAPGLKVEQIRRRSVVFNLNGQRFEMPM